MANISYHRRQFLFRSDLACLDDGHPHRFLNPYHPVLYSVEGTGGDGGRGSPVLEPTGISLDTIDDIESDPESVILNLTSLDPLDRHACTEYSDELFHFTNPSSSDSYSPPLRFDGSPPCSESDAVSELGYGFFEDETAHLEFGVEFSGAFHGELDEEGAAEGDVYFIQHSNHLLDSASTIGSLQHHPLLGEVGFGSDSEIDTEQLQRPLIRDMDSYANEIENYNVFEDDDVSVDIPFRWDSLRLDDNDDDFGWEEVAEEREISEIHDVEVDEEDQGESEDDDEISLSLISPIIITDDLVSIGDDMLERNGPNEAPSMSNVEWEVLLNANNLIQVSDRESDPQFAGNHSDYVYPAEYDSVFGQLLESENVLIDSHPPAARLVVESLPSVVITTDDLRSVVVICAVCKDEVGVGDVVNKLPCSHQYHGECIVPWLSIRNTCPVCRYELPTDNSDYERMRAAR